MAWRRSSAGGMAAPCRSAAPRQWAAVRRRACRATTATGRARWCCTTAVRRWPPRRTGTARCARRADVRQPPPRPRSPPPRTPAATRAARERPRWGPARPPAWQSARRSARPGRQTGAASPAPWWRAPPAPPRSAGDPSHPPWPAAHCRSRSPGPGGAAAPPPAATHGSPGRRGSGPAAGEHAAGGHHGRAATGRAPNPTGPARHHTPGRPAHPWQACARPGQGRLLPSAPVRLAPPARPSRTVGADGEGLARSRRARACCPGVAATNSDPRHEPEPQLIPTINAAPSSLQPQRESRLTAGPSVELDPACWQELLEELLGRVAGRFARVDLRWRARAFVGGLLAELPRKNCWTIAEHAGDPSPDGMQHLLARAVWDENAVRDDVRDWVVAHLGEEEATLLIDETGDLKKGTVTVGVCDQAQAGHDHDQACAGCWGAGIVGGRR